ADHYPACEEQENSTDSGDLQQLKRKMQQLGGRNAGIEIVNRVPDHLWQEYPGAIAEKNAENARHKAPAVTLEVGQERTHTLGNHSGRVDEILAGRGASFGMQVRREEVLGARPRL
ncbi:MAG: hypothetical protein WCD09_02865, partial [Candidatus Sulfotelmatobacter sp.]